MCKIVKGSRVRYIGKTNLWQDRIGELATVLHVEPLRVGYRRMVTLKFDNIGGEIRAYLKSVELVDE